MYILHLRIDYCFVKFLRNFMELPLTNMSCYLLVFDVDDHKREASIVKSYFRKRIQIIKEEKRVEKIM